MARKRRETSRGTVEQDVPAALGEREEFREHRGALRRRGYEDTRAIEVRGMGEEGVRRDDAAEREAVVERGADERVAGMHLGEQRRILRGCISAKRINPDERSRSIGGVLLGLEQMRNRFVDARVRHPAKRVVDGEQIQHRGSPDLALARDPAERHRQIDVRWTPAVAVIPRGIDPPGIVNVVAEHHVLAR